MAGKYFGYFCGERFKYTPSVGETPEGTPGVYAARAPKLMEEEENMPLRAGHRWTNDEDDDLIMLLTLHEDKQEIAEMLLRTVGAVDARTNLLYERGMIRIIDWRRQNRRIPGGLV